MNTDKRKFLFVFWLLIFGLGMIAGAQAQPKYSSKILLIPLDDRPPCLQKPVRLGAIADMEVVTPPRELLGKFTTYGQSDKIIEWIKAQDLRGFDAAVVSLDMLAYGGLVAMREYEPTTRETAQKRIDFVRELKRKNPRLPIYGSSVIMRLAPTGNIINEAYRVKLSRWAEIVSEKDNTKLQEEARRLETEIPAEALANYKKARERNLAGNFQAIELARQGVFDYLIVSQDDAHPTGVHVAERESLIKKVNELKLAEKVPVQPGADEVSMLLMARFASRKFNYAPRIFPVYSSEKTRTQVMPFEDRKLHETVSFHIRSIGASEVPSENQADLLFYVYASRLEEGRAKTFADEIEAKLKAGKKVLLVDVDPTARTEGAEPLFADELKNRSIFRSLSAYAAWNTAGNMIGTALPQALLFEAARKKFSADAEKPTWKQRNGRKIEGYYAVNQRINQAQDWFLMHRWLDDYVYNTLVRPEIRKFGQSKGWNPFRFPAEGTNEIEAFGLNLTKKYYEEARQLYKDPDQIRGLECQPNDNLSFELPWDRAFEAEIEFSLKCKDLLILKP